MAINVIPGSVLKIEVFGEIFNWAGEAETALTSALRAHSGPIRVLINSEGGDAQTGLALNAILSAYPDVTTHNIGIAASAAAMIFAAGRVRLVNSGSVTMMHRASAGGGGNADTMDEAARMLRAMDEAQVQLFVRATGKTEAQIRKAVAVSSWLTAQETLDLGLATSLAEPEQAAAKTVLQPMKSHGTRLDMSIRAKLGLPADATEEQVAQALDVQLAAARPATPQAPAPVAITADSIEAAVTRALAVREQSTAHANACVSAVERFIAEGKIAPAGRDKAIKACGTTGASLNAAVEYWTDAPKIIGSVDLPNANAGGGAKPKLTALQAKMCAAAKLTEEQYLETLAREGA